MGVLCGKDEEWVDWTAIDVENVLCAGEAGELCYVSLEVWECGSYGQTAPVFLPINTDVSGMDLGGWCELMWKGEKIGGSDVVATVMGEEWLRWVMMKLGSRVVCDWERRWREGGCCVREEARDVMS